MGKVRGTDIYLSVDTGSGWPGTKVGGQKDATFDRGKGTIDVTDKDSGGNEEHLPGNRNWSISFDAFLVEADNQGWLDMEASYEADTQLTYWIVTPAFKYKGVATIESLSMVASQGDVSVVSFTLKGTKGLTKTPIG